MKKLMVIVGCVAVAMLNAVAGTTNQVAVASTVMGKDVVQARAEREEQRRRLVAIQDELKKARGQRLSMTSVQKEQTKTREEPSVSVAEGNTTVDALLDIYSEQVGKTLLRDPSVQNTPIKFKVCEKQELTKEEYIGALEAVLEMNGVHLEPDGEKLIRVFPSRDAIKKGVPLVMTPQRLEERGRIVSMMMPFKNIGVAEAQKSLEGLRSNSGVFFVYERTNSILVTDVDKNINRMLSIARTIDVATLVSEGCFVRQKKQGN